MLNNSSTPQHASRSKAHGHRKLVLIMWPRLQSDPPRQGNVKKTFVGVGALVRTRTFKPLNCFGPCIDPLGILNSRIFYLNRIILYILYIKWNFVRGSYPPFFRTVLQYRTVVHICCTCAVKKNTRRTTGTRRDTHHGHKKGSDPRASQGRALRC